MNKIEFIGTIAAVMDQEYGYPEYPNHFASDCKVLWMNSYSPEDAAEKLALDYGWNEIETQKINAINDWVAAIEAEFSGLGTNCCIQVLY